MSAQIIPFPKAKKRAAKVSRGPCAKVIELPTVTRNTRKIPRSKPAPDDRLDELFHEFLIKRGIISEPASS